MSQIISKDTVPTFLKNPIGFMGLLAVLFESIIAIVFGCGMSQLQGAWERMPFIITMALFPLIVLGTFIYLVCCHHTKLYGPSDYRTDESFIVLSREQAHNRIEKEAIHILENEHHITDKSDSEKSSEHDSSSKETTDENLEQRRNRLIKTINTAEEEGIKEAERYLGIKLSRNVVFRGDAGESFEIDGFGKKDGTIQIVEVRLIRPTPISEPIERAVTQLRKKISILTSEGIRAQSLLVCVVSDLNDTIKDKIENRFLSTYPEGNILVIGFDKKKIKFKS